MKMKKVIAGLLVSMMFSTSALAWGEREQGILAGVAGLWIFQQLDKAGNPQQPPVVVYQNPPVYQQAPVYQAPPVQITPPVVTQHQQWCEWTPVTDQFGNQRAIRYCYYR
jgi:hypothetical protein